MNIDHDKLFRLEMDCEAIHHARFGNYQRQQDIAAEIRDLLGSMRPSNLWKPQDGTAVLLQRPEFAERLPEEVKTARRIEALRREAVALRVAAAAFEAPLFALTQLVDACRQHAASVTPENPATDFPTIVAQRSDLAAIRGDLAAGQAERRRVAESTFQREEAREALRSLLDRAASEGAARARRLIAFGDGADLFATRTSTGRVDLLPLLVTLLGPDAIEAALRPHVDVMPASVPADERAAILAELDARILALEEEDELAVLAREAAGQKPGRRGNANPAVVLRMRGAVA